MSLFIAAVIAIAMVGVFVQWQMTRLERRQLSSREILDDNAIYTRFYAGEGFSRGEVLNVWHEIAETLNVPSGCLRPEDRFGKDIGTHLITSEAFDALAEKGQLRAKQLGLSINLEKVTTVDEYVRCFARGKL